MVSLVMVGKESKVTLWAIEPLLSHSRTCPALMVAEVGLNWRASVCLTVTAAVCPCTTVPGPLAPLDVAAAEGRAPADTEGTGAPEAGRARSARWAGRVAG